MSSQKPLIVCVDDEEAISSGMAFAFETYLPQFDVKSFTDPNQALKALDGQQPIVAVVSDFLMPGMNGVDMCYKLIDQLKSAGQIIKPYAIVFSAYDSDHIANSVLNVDRMGYIDQFRTKGISYKRLAEAIKEHLAKAV